jgi:type II secretion system protein G
MNAQDYFYRDKEGREIGPLALDALAKCRLAGVLDGDTPVRTADSTEWRPCREVIADPQPPPSAPPSPLVPAAHKLGSNRRIRPLFLGALLLISVAGGVVLKGLISHYSAENEEAQRKYTDEIDKIGGRLDESRAGADALRINATKLQIATFMSALKSFNADNGYYPKGKNGLLALVQKPFEATNWRGPYMPQLPKDSWGRDFIYECPGRHNLSSYDLMSMGPDGRVGGGDDITNWR